jgi:hypothetical protein
MQRRRHGLAIAASATAAVAALAVTSFATAAMAATGATVKVKGPTYSKTFKVLTCKNKGETDISLTGTAAGGDAPLRLRIVGKYRSGTLTIRGDINLDGKLTSIVVGDSGAINVKGRFTTAGSKGPFAVTGRCA